MIRATWSDNNVWLIPVPARLAGVFFTFLRQLKGISVVQKEVQNCDDRNEEKCCTSKKVGFVF